MEAGLLDSERDVLTSMLRLMTANPFGAWHERIRRGLAEYRRKRYRPVNLTGGDSWRLREAELIIGDPSCGLRNLTAADRVLVQRALLVVLFHRHAEDFSRYIDQVAAAPTGAASPEATFIDDIRVSLRRRGLLGRDGFLSEDDVCHLFALLYQLCRASRFISGGLVGDCPSMRRLRMGLWNSVFSHDLWQYADGLYDRMEDFSTLILGATGSGKGAAARAIGLSGFIAYDRRQRRFVRSYQDSFVATVLAQHPANLIESAIFGHEAGAFTGASARMEGVLGTCLPGGTVFLDEIGEIDRHVQVKLLQVLQERRYTRVGGQAVERFHGRVVAATNRPLTQLLGENVLRRDFFYRLCSDVIDMPSLQQRVEEDPAELDRLLRHTVEGIVGGGVAADRLTPAVAAAIRSDLGLDYEWPGNVRELEQCVRRYVLRRNCRGIAVPQRAPTAPAAPAPVPDALAPLVAAVRDRAITRDDLLAAYAQWVFRAERNYKAVARTLGVKDARTIKKYLGAAAAGPSADGAA